MIDLFYLEKVFEGKRNVDIYRYVGLGDSIVTKKVELVFIYLSHYFYKHPFPPPVVYSPVKYIMSHVSKKFLILFIC